MSLETHTSVVVMPDPHGDGRVRSEPDVQVVKPIFVTLTLVIVVFLISIFWAFRIQRRAEAELAHTTDENPGAAAHAGHYEVGIINQQQFGQETRAVETHEQSAQELKSYGWADREKQLIHVPLEQGIQKVLSAHPKERK